MKLCLVLTLSMLTIFAHGQSPKTDEEKASYSVGVQMGRALESGKSLLDLDRVIQGLTDVLSEGDLAMTQEECIQHFQKWQQEARDVQAKEMTAEGETFLAENADRNGVTVLPSGLQYEVLKEGTGEIPKAGDTIKAHYEGKLINGNVFDSSYERGQPFEAPVGGLIPGWTEALQLMKVGSKWKLYIPYNLAYGARGAGADIPPYSTLIFEMELLDIVEKP